MSAFTTHLLCLVAGMIVTIVIIKLRQSECVRLLWEKAGLDRFVMISKRFVLNMALTLAGLLVFLSDATSTIIWLPYKYIFKKWTNKKEKENVQK